MAWRNGTLSEPDRTYAGFHLRVFAGVLDFLFVTGLVFLAAVALSYWTAAIDIDRLQLPNFRWFNVLLVWAYYAVFESSRLRATPGKALLRIIVSDRNGLPITLARATLRFPLKVFSVATIVGVLVIPFNRRRLALHDALAGTRVLLGSPGPVPQGIEAQAADAAGATVLAAETTRARRGMAVPALVTLSALLVCAIVFWQHGAWVRVRGSLRQCEDSLEADLQKGRAAQRKWDQFQEEVRRIEGDLAMVRVILPPRLDVEAFLKGFDRELADRRIAGKVVSRKFFRRGRVFRVEIQIDVSGNLDEIADALQDRCCEERLTHWRGASFTDGGVTGNLSLYSTPEPASPAANPCGERRPDLWLWPFTQWSAEALARVTTLQRLIAPIEKESDAVRHYERVKADLQERIEIINRLRRPQAPPAPSDPEMEPEVPIREPVPGVKS